MQGDNNIISGNKHNTSYTKEVEQSPHRIIISSEQLASNKNSSSSSIENSSTLMSSSNISSMNIQKSKSQQDLLESSEKSERRVLILYVSGFIGFQRSGDYYISQKGYLEKMMRSIPSFCDRDFTFFNTCDNFIVTPLSIYNKRIWFSIIELDKLDFSANISAEGWLSVATLIQDEYHKYDSFIILCGTDTLSYTASALSFIFENLSKTVILTGAAVPLTEMRNDAYSNLLGALTIAGHYTIPEVCLFFRDKLFRANRTTRTDAIGFEAYESPNFPALATFGINVQINWDLIRKKPSTTEKFSVFKNFSNSVGTLRLYPLMPEDYIESVLLKSNLDSFIIQSYGRGNLPKNQFLTETILTLKNKNKIIVNVSQCSKGMVQDRYSKQMTDWAKLGVINGLDMTFETATIKLGYLLGKGYSIEKVKELMGVDLRGEITEIKIKNYEFETEQETFSEALQKAIKNMNLNIHNQVLKEALLPALVIQAAGMGYVDTLQELSKLGAEFNLPDDDGRKPIHIASAAGHIHVVQFLISQESHIDLNATDYYGKTALIDAIFNLQEPVAQLLVNAGAQLNFSQNYVRNLLFKSIQNGELKIIQILYNIGFSNWNDIKDSEYRNLVHVAVGTKQTHILQFLKHYTNIDFHAQDYFKRSPIDYAILDDYKSLILTLFQQHQSQDIHNHTTNGK